MRLAGLGALGGAPAFTALVAGAWLVSDREVPELAPFAAHTLPPGIEAGDWTDWRRRTVERVVRREAVHVARAVRTVACLRLGQGWELTISGVCRLGVAADGSEVALLAAQPDVAPGMVAECVLGPGLILALAARGTYCLHASAVQTAAGAIAFLGDSGAGKSTLAQFFAETVPGCVRLADDILPVRLDADRVEALPRFPQLKLPVAGQVGGETPERVPLRLACVLDPEPAEQCAAVRAEPLAPLPASLALLRHTVAARLFDRHLAAEHLASCGRAAASGAVTELRYPFHLDSLPGIATALGSRCHSEEARRADEESRGVRGWDCSC